MDELKIKKTKCSEKLWVPKNLNYEETTEYFVSKSTSAAVPSLYNSDDISGRDVFTNCEITKKNLYRLEKKHAQALEDAKLTREELNKQWFDLEKKEIEFRKNFTFFDEFVKENETKRFRALAKLDDTNKLIEKRSKDVAEVKEQLEDSQRAKADMDTVIKKLMLYEDFLKQVRDKYSHLFDTETDTIKRYSSLLEARTCVGTYYERSLKELENSQKESAKQIEEYCVKIAGLRNELADLTRRYEISKTKSEKWCIVLNEIAAEAMSKLLERIYVKDTCWKIYKDICERKQLPLVRRDDYEKQFDFIKKMLYQYECVNEMNRYLEEEKLKISEKACLSSVIS